MNEVVSLDRVRLTGTEKAWSAKISEGAWGGVLSTQAEFGSEVVAWIGGSRNATHGNVYRRAETYIPITGELGRLTVLGALTKIAGKQNSASRISHALVAAGLEQARKQSVSSCSVELLERLQIAMALVSNANVVCLDFALDRLDPLRLKTVLDALRETPRTLVIATRRLDIVEQMDQVLILHEKGLAFHGTLDELRRSVMPVRYEVITTDRSTASAVAKRFKVSILETEHGFSYSAEQGQEIAAKLLTHGYGAVETVIEVLPTLSEAVHHVLENAATGLPLDGKRYPIGHQAP